MTRIPTETLETANRLHRAGLVRYATRLLRDAHRAEDVVQDVLMRLQVQEVEAVADHLAEWLYTVCRRRALDVLKKEGRMQAWDETIGEGGDESDTGGGAAARIVAQEDLALALRLLERLPAAQQEVLRLKFQNGFTYAQIARITQRTTSHVGVLIHEGLASLRRDWRACSAT